MHFGPKYHHETLDGMGYPEGLIGNLIPYEDQIIKVADDYDALVTKRQYKTHIHISDTLKELIKEVGSPLFLSSANKSGKDVCKSLDEIEIECPTLDGMVMGDVSFGEASTIVDCTGNDIKIQRQGPISEDEIMMVINK